MEPEKNPVNKVGVRNFECPHYEACTAVASGNRWPFWACSDCSLKLAGTGVTVIKGAHTGRATSGQPTPFHG